MTPEEKKSNKRFREQLAAFIICWVIIAAALLSMCSSCSGTKQVANNYGMNVSNVKIECYDTISSQVLNRMISEKTLPELRDWQVSTLTNYEEGKTYTFYFYFDQPTNRMLTLKRLISGNDTAYVRMNKILK